MNPTNPPYQSPHPRTVRYARGLPPRRLARSVPAFRDGETGRDWGGDYVIRLLGECPACRRDVFGVDRGKGVETVDPRGPLGEFRTAVCVSPEEHGYASAPDAFACWDCYQEHGREGYEHVIGLLAKRHGWVTAE